MIEVNYISILSIIALSFLVIWSAVGNILIIFVMLREPKLRQKSGSFYIIPLALADLSLSAIGAPLSLVKDISFGACAAIISFMIAACWVSINLLVALSIDRYFCTCHITAFLEFKRAGKRKWIILFCVILGILLGIYPIVEWNDGAYADTCYLIEMINFNYIVVLIVTMVGSAVTIIILYTLIFRNIAKV